ncbi:MAG: 16S rRNA (guanine(527)-N(7))-methyltransferase RsmG [Bacteroidales bacterium]|nr:16S rRNA (guanine(527)-N(7))-methyltransferase RsmG [Bacteroidales bacterium]
MAVSLIFNYFPELTEKQKEQFLQLENLYQDWNSKINVISRKDMDSFYLHHVLHSLAIAKYVPFKAYTEIMDAGTGGGFPGIPLAILFPEAKFYLVDSIGKKIKVVQAVAEALGLENVEAEQIRMEQVNRTFDFVISRAVTDLEVFSKWTLYKIHSKSFNKVQNGIIYLKGTGVEEEIERVKKLAKIKVRTTSLSKYFEEEFFETKQIVHVYKK